MIWIIFYTGKAGQTLMYICKADSIEQACMILDLQQGAVSHSVITIDEIDTLSKIDAGYIKKEL